jgi:hypothetical protein
MRRRMGARKESFRGGIGEGGEEVNRKEGEEKKNQGRT